MAERFNRLMESFSDWLQHRRALGEAQDIEAGEFNRIADELGVGAEALGALLRQGPHAADELPRMLEQLGLDADAISRAQPMVYHDMERVCARCMQKARCDRDLHARTAAQHYEDYCANAQTIDAISPGAS